MKRNYSDSEIIIITAAEVGNSSGNGSVSEQLALPKASVEQTSKSNLWVPWGTNNLFPQEVIDDINGNGLVGACINFKQKAIVSTPIAYGFYYTNPDTGKLERMRVMLDEVEDFWDRSYFTNYRRQVARDYYGFANIVPRFVKNKGRDKIAALYAEPAETYRSGWQNDKGIVTKGYLSANWKNITLAEPIELAAIDPYWNPARQIIESSASDFLMCLSDTLFGNVYYDLATWNAIRDNGILNIANKIPRNIDKLMDNQLSVAWQIEIPKGYWKERFDKWDDWDTNTQATKKREVMKDIIKSLKGVDNAGGAIITTYEQEGKEITNRIIITQFDMRAKDGLWVEDSSQMSRHLMNSFSINPVLLDSPGKDRTSGSGSDIRVAMNVHLLLCQPDVEVMMRPMNIVSKVNGYDDVLRKYLKGMPFAKNLNINTDTVRLRYWMDIPEINTLNQGKEVSNA